MIEEYVITGVGHGTPLSTLGTDNGETVGPYMLETGISSTQHSLRFWGIQAARPKPMQEPVTEAANKARSEPARAKALAPATVSRTADRQLPAAGR